MFTPVSLPNVTPELAVRRYLQFLISPESLVDTEELRGLEAAASAATDPIDRLRAISAVHAARVVDGRRLKADFISYARDFAFAEEIRVEAFQEMGVPDDVLRAAGLLGGRTRRPHGIEEGGRPHRRSRSNRRSPRLHLEEVETKLPEGEFRLAELATAIDREVTTTRNYLNRLVADGKVQVVGEDASGRGKPAKIYRKG